MSRYLIAIPLPAKAASALRELYQATYGDRLRVRFLHITILPPFTLNDPHSFDTIQEELSTIPDFDQSFHYGDPGIFHNTGIKNSRRIMYLPVKADQRAIHGSTTLTTSVSPLHEVYTSLLSKFRDLITFKAVDFKHNEIPEFLPHVTLSYKFKGDERLFTPPHDPLLLPAPQLFAEAGPGLWEAAQEDK